MSSRLIFLLISVVLVWILAVNSGNSLAYSLAYMITALLLASWWWARSSMRNVNLRRLTRTQRSQVGQLAEETFEISNRGRLPKLWLEIEDHSRLPWHNASRVISNLPRNTSERWQIRTPCIQRGRFRLGPMTLRSGDPLGIFKVEQEITETGSIVVYPLAVELTTFHPSTSDLSGGEARRQRTFQVTPNVATVRDYLPGDSMNRIHWPTTARSRRLMTKEFELDPTADIWIFLDLFEGAQFERPWTPPQPEIGLFSTIGRRSLTELPPSTTEYGVTAAASLARYFLLHDRAVGMSSYGRSRWFVQTDRGERQIGKLMESLAVVEGKGTLPISHLIATDGVRLNRNDTILAISADPNPEWAVALQDSQRRGVNSIAIVIDGGTFGQPVQYDAVVSRLEMSRISHYRIACGQTISDALSQPVHAGSFSR
jgi:uncharacterized protein (DUF58 family)